MIIRDYKPGDFVALKKIHESQPTKFDFNVMRFPYRVVAEKDGIVIGALLGRPSVQVDLLLSQEMAPKERFDTIGCMESYGIVYLKSNGFAQIHCYVPNSIVRSYGKRLVRDFGFTREENACFLKEI